jgi:hypothetical protein
MATDNKELSVGLPGAYQEAWTWQIGLDMGLSGLRIRPLLGPEIVDVGRFSMPCWADFEPKSA